MMDAPNNSPGISFSAKTDKPATAKHIVTPSINITRSFVSDFKMHLLKCFILDLSFILSQNPNEANRTSLRNAGFCYIISLRLKAKEQENKIYFMIRPVELGEPR